MLSRRSVPALHLFEGLQTETVRLHFDASAILRRQKLRVFSLPVLQAARALVLFIFEPSDVFRGIGEALQAGFEDGGIGDPL